MARKRQYGTGCVLETKGGFAIRWREPEIAPDGRRRNALRYETLGRVSRKQASQVLAERIAVASAGTVITSQVLFSTIVDHWLLTVLPMYKASTQKNHRHIVEKHLRPRFGREPMSAVTRQMIQAYVAQLAATGYAPKTVDHIHDVVSAILRTAVEWGHLRENPALGVRLPKLVTVRKKWALTAEQAAQLLDRLPPLPRTLVALALFSGVRRGELFALRWQDVDEAGRVLKIDQAVYEGAFGTPKTEAGRRPIPLTEASLHVIAAWKPYARSMDPERLVFATRSGKPIEPNNVLRRWVYPACAALGLPNASWLTFRRTFSTWAHERGIPAKVAAQVLGHANVDVTLNVYTQVTDGATRTAVETVGDKLFRIVQSSARASELTH